MSSRLKLCILRASQHNARRAARNEHRLSARRSVRNGRFDGMMHAMVTTIDEAGRMVIPRDVRRAAGLEPGMLLDVYVEDGAVVIEPAPTPVRIERRGRFSVAQPASPVPKLEARVVEQTREDLRTGRRMKHGKKPR
jgi:AbrB family looped-hinge helix DNA binding protein